MSWARLDDRANEHRKQLRAGAEACWLWACGLMYANRNPARDGLIPDEMLTILYPFRNAKKLAARLVDVGLWERIDGGFFIHNYHQYNPTAEQIELERAAGRDRAKRSYERRRGKSSPEDTPKTPKNSSGVLRDSSGSTPLHSTPNHRSADADPPKAPQGADARRRQDSDDHQTATVAQPTQPTRNQRAVPLEAVLVPTRTRAPSSLEEALQWPLEARSKACLEFDGEWAVPQQWPEVVSVAEGLAKALGRAPSRLGSIRRDSGVRAILGLYADGVTHEELLRAVEATARDDWWRSGRKGLSSLTPEVVRRLLEGGARPERRETAAEMRERMQREARERAEESGDYVYV